MRTATALALLPLALAAPSKRATPAPVIKPRGAQLVDGKYIVKMKAEANADSVQSSIQSVSSDADFVYNSSKFKGFAGSLSAEELEDLKNNDDVCRYRSRSPQSLPKMLIYLFRLTLSSRMQL